MVAVLLGVGIGAAGCILEEEGRACEGSSSEDSENRVYFEWTFDEQQAKSIEWKPQTVTVAIREGSTVKWSGEGPTGCYAAWTQPGSFRAVAREENPKDPLCAWVDFHDFTKAADEANHLPLELAYVCR